MTKVNNRGNKAKSKPMNPLEKALQRLRRKEKKLRSMGDAYAKAQRGVEQAKKDVEDIKRAKRRAAMRADLLAPSGDEDSDGDVIMRAAK